MPWAVRDYVNRTLDRNPLYAGNIGPVQIHLWRGAYTIHEIRIVKTSGKVSVPFFAAPAVDLSVEWGALWHGAVVGGERRRSVRHGRCSRARHAQR